MENLDKLRPEENKIPKQNQGNPMIKIAIIAALALSLSWNTITHSRDKDLAPSWQVDEQKNNNIVDEERESVNSYEAIFKEGIRKTLNTVNSLDDIPVGGKKIEYYRLEWSQKWEKMDPETIKKLRFPESFDITPKEIIQPTTTIEISVGDRYFTVCPDVGKFTGITMTQNALQLNISAIFSFTKEYDKNEKLPSLLLKLWNTPRGPWVKTWFPGSVITEIRK